MGCRFGRAAPAVALLLLLVPVRSWAQNRAVEEEPVLVQDSRSSYAVGFSELSALELPPEYRYLATSLPRLIVDAFDSGTDPNVDHTLSPGERTEYARHLTGIEEISAIISLSAAIEQRDRLLFAASATDETRLAAEEAVAAAAARLEKIRALQPAEVLVESSKPIVFWQGRSTGRLLEPVALNDDFSPDRMSLDRIIADADLDLLIWGVVEEIRGYLKVDFYAHSPYQGSVDIGEAGTVALPTDIGQDAEIIAGEIASVLLGRPWGSVSVTSNVSDAAIYVGGELAGFGRALDRYRVPGETRVEVRAPGFRTLTLPVVVRARNTVELEVELEPITNRTVRLESAPPDADVYVDSVWAGRTPLDVRVPETPQVVRIRAPGHLESRFVMTRESPERVARVLLPETVVWSEEISAKRGEFYRSLTWFVLSVPVTMILNGVYQGIESAYPPPSIYDGLSLEEKQNLEPFGQRGNIFYFASGGSLMLNLGLLVNAGINLFEYLDVGEGAHNQ
jgi:hypothetical protein